jgi:urease accessory protein
MRSWALVPADLAGVRGTLEATFSGGPESPRVMTSAPLQLRGPFPSSDGLPLFLLKNVTAGVLAEDRYNVTLIATPGARARVSTASATKVHAMRHGRAEMRLSVRAEEGSCIIYDPAPVILQAGSDIHQATRIVAEPGATAVVSDVVVFGRLARGERFAFRRFSSDLSIRRCAEAPPYHSKRFVLTPDHDRAGIEAAMGDHGVLGTLIAAAPGAARNLDRIRSRLSTSDHYYAGASVLPGDEGVIVQVLASRPDAALQALLAAESAILDHLR